MKSSAPQPSSDTSLNRKLVGASPVQVFPGSSVEFAPAITQQLAEPFPSRGAAGVLTRRVRSLLSSGLLQVGDRFLTDDELVDVTKLSRSTVRRALAGLRDEGWLKSQAGLGTYVGRVVGDEATTPPRTPKSPRALRLGLIAFSEDSPESDWFKPAVLRGIHNLAHGYDARVELLSGIGGSDTTLEEGLARIERSGVDAVACLSVNPGDALLLRLATERGIRCLLAGTSFPDLPVPRVCEDNRDGMDALVRRLAGLGHERIGLVMRRWPSPWLFKRHEQWHDTRRELDLPMDEGLMHWLPQDNEPLMADAAFTDLARWIERSRPSVVVCGHWAPVLHLGQLMRNGVFSVPDDFSLVVIDQYPEVPSMLGVEPATLEVPLEEIGRSLVRMSAQWAAGKRPASLTKLPMAWRDGATLRAR